MPQAYLSELQNARTLAKISRVEAALILLAIAGLPEVKTVCDKLVVKLRDDAWQWVAGEDLETSALAILAVHMYQPDEIDGTCLAHLTNNMLASEAKVGGPYYNSQQSVDVTTNLVISKLFRSFDSPLENVELFLRKHHSPATPHDAPGIICLFLRDWPRYSFSKAEIQSIGQVLPFLAEALNYKTTLAVLPLAPAPHELISQRVYNELQDIASSLRPHALSVWKMVNKADVNHEISMLPLYFARSLAYQPKILKSELSIKLGTANFFVWMAYIIYDDFIDQEGQAELLPVANNMLRKAMVIYEKMSRKNPALWEEILAAFDKMDAANSWELAHCRYEIDSGRIQVGRIPAYSRYFVLADRAWGHVLGPMILMNKLQTMPAQVLDIQKAFRHFLIAKQLSDDLMDWQDDIKKGHISAVVAHMLKATSVVPGPHNLAEITHSMQEYMWSQGIKEVNDIILKQLTISKRYFKKSSLVHFDGEFFLHVFDPLEESVRKNELQAVHQKQFLTTYSSESIKE